MTQPVWSPTVFSEFVSQTPQIIQAGVVSPVGSIKSRPSVTYPILAPDLSPLLLRLYWDCTWSSWTDVVRALQDLDTSLQVVCKSRPKRKSIDQKALSNWLTTVQATPGWMHLSSRCDGWLKRLEYTQKTVLDAPIQYDAVRRLGGNYTKTHLATSVAVDMAPFVTHGKYLASGLRDRVCTAQKTGKHPEEYVLHKESAPVITYMKVQDLSRFMSFTWESAPTTDDIIGRIATRSNSDATLARQLQKAMDIGFPQIQSIANAVANDINSDNIAVVRGQMKRIQSCIQLVFWVAMDADSAYTALYGANMDQMRQLLALFNPEK